MAKPTAKKPKEVIRDGVRYLEWSDDAFPSATPREVWENSESFRILQFIRLHENSKLAWPPDGLNTKIESDNGRLRLWLEIKENTSRRAVLGQFNNLVAWKALLVAFDKKRDPLPHPIPTILNQLDVEKQRPEQVSKQINAWIASQMYAWEKGNNSQRRHIDRDVAGVLSHFGFSNEQSDEIMNQATKEIRLGRYPFPKKSTPKGNDEGVMLPRNAHPVTRKLLSSFLRTWRIRT